jgi:capsular polysaccharide transport system permease protein
MNTSRAPVPDAAVPPVPPVPFRAALKTQMRIVGALLMREIITRYGRHNIGFMWLFVEPMMFTLGVLMVWTLLGGHKTQLPVVLFTLSGYSTVLLWRNTINRCGNAIVPNQTLMHHRNVRAMDLFVTRIVLEAAGATMSFLLLGVALGLLGQLPMPQDLLKMVCAWLLLTWFSASMALLIGGLVVMSEAVERVWHVISYLFLPVSGAFFMVSWLPQRFQHAVLWVPTVSCTELLREGWLGTSIHAMYDIPYVMVFNLVIMLPGLLLIRYISEHGVD